jgi:hypothetical protein
LRADTKVEDGAFHWKPLVSMPRETTPSRMTKQVLFRTMIMDRENPRFHCIPIGQFWWGFFVRAYVESFNATGPARVPRPALVPGSGRRPRKD